MKFYDGHTDQDREIYGRMRVDSSRGNEKEDDNNNNSKYYGNVWKVTALVFTILSIFILLNVQSRGPQKQSIMEETETVNMAVSKDSLPALTLNQITASDMSFGIQVVSPGYGALKSLSNLPWDMIVEPSRRQEIYLLNPLLEGKSFDLNPTEYLVQWTIDGKTYKGLSTTFQIDKVGKYTSSIQITAQESGEKLINRDFVMMVKYVRREIRTLIDDDRKRFFDSMYKLYTVDETTGLGDYGAKFKTAEHFLYKHMLGAATIDCDHWHDGSGIVVNHGAITLEFEQALQSIDPSVSVPYWEYAKDELDYGNFMNSEIFKPTWFGEVSPSHKLHRINDGGPWSKIQVPSGDKYKSWPKDSSFLNPFVNSYGQMRSSWNNNPSPYICRSNTTYGKTEITLPSCSTLQSCFESVNLKEMFACINGATHGPVHINVGGAWGDDDLIDTHEAELSFLRSPHRPLLFKIMWRMGYTRCPTTCDEENPESCRCSVPKEFLDKYGARNILERTGILTLLSKRLPSTSSDKTMEMVLKLLESPGIIGDMFTSASAWDPSFWPLHGSAERLLNHKRIQKSQGMLAKNGFDEEWGFPSYDPEKSLYLKGVCDWSGVESNEDLTMPVCDEDAACEGHGPDDSLAFGNFLSTNDRYTNAEFYDFMHPWNEALPYTFDTFDYDYCAEAGHSF